MNLIDASALDLEMETPVTDSFLVHLVIQMTQNTESQLTAEVCDLSTDKLEGDGVLLHGTHLLKRQGEVILEFPCDSTIVRTREGFTAEGSDCLDHLPVFTPEGELSYLAPITRILVDRPGVWGDWS